MLGDRIAERRKQLGWSQVDLAQRLGVASTRISEFESGLKTDCNLSTARRLARVLGCSIDYLAATWDTQEDPEPAPVPPAGPRRLGPPQPVTPAAGEQALPRGSRANTKFHISAFVSACKWRRLNSREMSAELKTQTAPSSTRTLPNR